MCFVYIWTALHLSRLVSLLHPWLTCPATKTGSPPTNTHVTPSKFLQTHYCIAKMDKYAEIYLRKKPFSNTLVFLVY